ncbi:uncharacterized protein LOC129595416 isoform X2 [Paramacrobiotus metropolitanus]|uniref:uncharacterized protein LOC129595416 isoform X2 n=1 Tax=Paramacrobiotus metropolitanus TaxID=2943436 RepID=UPI002445E88D|nr:uncharacterized protein LOC129595416 isoform X2 [Paramacrobiotus metropolitanus]
MYSQNSDGRDSGLSSCSDDTPVLTLRDLFDERRARGENLKGECDVYEPDMMGKPSPQWTMTFDLAKGCAVFSKVDECWGMRGVPPHVALCIRLCEMVVDGTVMIIPTLYHCEVSQHPLNEWWTMQAIGKRSVTGWVDILLLKQFLETCLIEKVKQIEDELGGPVMLGVDGKEDELSLEDEEEQKAAPVGLAVQVQHVTLPVEKEPVLPAEVGAGADSPRGLAKCRFCDLERRPDKLPAHEKYCMRKRKMENRREFAWTVGKRA